MIILLFILLVTLSGVIITLVTDSDKYFHPQKVWGRKPNLNGWVVIVFSIVIMILTACQFLYQRNLDRDKDDQAKKEKKNSDAEMFSNYKKSLDTVEMKRENTDTVLFRMLAAQGISNKDMQAGIAKGLKKIADSSTKNEVRPYLALTGGKEFVYDSVVNNLYYFTYSVTILDAPASNFEMTLDAMIHSSLQGYSFKGKTQFLSPTVTLPKDQSFSNSLYFGNIVKFESVYFWIRGTFQNEKKTITYPSINILYHYDMNTKKIGILRDTAIYNKVIIQFLEHE